MINYCSILRSCCAVKRTINRMERAENQINVQAYVRMFQLRHRKLNSQFIFQKRRKWSQTGNHRLYRDHRLTVFFVSGPSTL